MTITITRKWYLRYLAVVETLEGNYINEFMGWSWTSALNKAEDFVHKNYPEVSRVRRCG